MEIILVNDVLAYIVPGQKQILLSIFGNKKNNVGVKKLTENAVSELILSDNKFELRLSVIPKYEGIQAFVKSPELPSPEDWYEVLNFKETSAYQLLAEVDNKNGEFKDKFEAAFLDTSVTFLNNKMSTYSIAEDEMTRRFYVEVGKKTRKWIPGHRYDNADGTYYYLGKYLSRKKQEFDSVFGATLEDLSEVSIYTKKIKPGQKKISDVFKDGIYGEDLFVVWNESSSFPSCVDSGQILEDDSPSLRNLYLEMYRKATPKNQDDLKNLFDVLCFSSYTDKLDYPEELTESVRVIIQDLIKKAVYGNWNRSRARNEIGDSCELGDNVERIKSLVLRSIGDGNVMAKYYYSGLFAALSINLDDEIKNWLSGWNEKDLISNFDTFWKNQDYFLKRLDINLITIYQRSSDKKKKIADVFGEGELGKAIIDLATYAANNYGEGVNKFRASSFKKVTSYNCAITLDDIIKFRDNPELREEILNYKFSQVIILFEQGKPLE